jgi:hypothetical protein
VAFCQRLRAMMMLCLVISSLRSFFSMGNKRKAGWGLTSIIPARKNEFPVHIKPQDSPQFFLPPIMFATKAALVATFFVACYVH